LSGSIDTESASVQNPQSVTLKIKKLQKLQKVFISDLIGMNPVYCT